MSDTLRVALSASRLRALLPGPDDLSTARRAPRRDLIAGLTVAIVALPLALAFGVSSGLGGEAGLITAIVGGAIAAIFGGSNLQVSGPTGAMTVVLIPVVHRYGIDGALSVGLLAGAFLVALAFLRVGRLVRLLPLPVIEGFTLGIAVVIALQQVPAALGRHGGGGESVTRSAWDGAADFLAHPQLAAPVLALGVATVMLLGARWRPGLPFSLAAVAVATLAANLAGLEVARIGALPSSLPAPSLGFLDPARLPSLIAPAMAVAALAALESLLCATVADGMTVGERHDPDRELFGQGLANLAVPLFGGVPATAAIARTAVNVRAGGRSRLAALTHAAILALIVLAAAPLVSQIPLAALAGVLLATTVRMVDTAALRALLGATRRDAVVLTATFAATVLLDLVAAVGLGVAIACLLALRTMAQSASLEEVELDHADHGDEERRLLSERIVAFRPAGPLFFGAADRFLADLGDVEDIDVVILRCSALTAIDASGARVLGASIAQMQRRGITVLLSGLAADDLALLRRLSPTVALPDEAVHATTPAAIDHARALTIRAARDRVAA